MKMITVPLPPDDYGLRHDPNPLHVDGDILSGVSSAVLVGRDLVDLKCVGWADKEAQMPCASTTSSGSFPIRS